MAISDWSSDVCLSDPGAGYALAREGRKVVLLERERQPGYHTTGRSAALFAETYGNKPIRALTVASRDFLMHPPAGFTDGPILTPRGALHAGTAEQAAALDPNHDESLRLVPTVRPLERTRAE